MVDAFSQIPDGYGSGRGYGRGMGGRMMAGRGFGNSLCPFAIKELAFDVLSKWVKIYLCEENAMSTLVTWIFFSLCKKCFDI